MRKTSLASRSLAALTLAISCGGCLWTEPIDSDRAVLERAAIHHELRKESGTLFAIAAKRARLRRADLGNRPVTCAVSSIDIQFISETHATYTASYACGVPPWHLGKGDPATTSTVWLDVLKEGGAWQINGFL
jgi:hypothetical protein